MKSYFLGFLKPCSRALMRTGEISSCRVISATLVCTTFGVKTTRQIGFVGYVIK